MYKRHPGAIISSSILPWPWDSERKAEGRTADQLYQAGQRSLRARARLLSGLRRASGPWMAGGLRAASSLHSPGNTAASRTDGFEIIWRINPI